MAISLVGLRQELEIPKLNEKAPDFCLSPSIILEVDYSLSYHDALLQNGINQVNPRLSLETRSRKNLGLVSIVAYLLSFDTTTKGCSRVLSDLNSLGFKPLGWYETIHYNKYWTQENSAIIALDQVFDITGLGFDRFQVACLCADGVLDMVSYECEKSKRCQYLVIPNTWMSDVLVKKTIKH